MTTEAERETIRQSWRDRTGSRMPPIAASIGRCPECRRWCGVIDGKLNDHAGELGLVCASGPPEEVSPL